MALLLEEATRFETEDAEAILDRWSQGNELDAYARLDQSGIQIITNDDGRLLATLPDLATFEDFATNADHNLAA